MGGRRDCWLCHTARNVIGRTCSQRCKKVQKEKLIQKQLHNFEQIKGTDKAWLVWIALAG